MQPYFLPYLGYFQLVNAVDQFVIYDDVQYTKQSWFNRNRFLLNGKPRYFTVPVKSDSDYLNVSEREVSERFEDEREVILAQFKQAYGKAPYFSKVVPVINDILNNENRNLYQFIRYSFDRVCEYLEIDTPVVESSQLNRSEGLSGKERLIKICNKLNCSEYINLPGGKSLYDKDEFSGRGIRLLFLEPNLAEYQQFSNEFVSRLSIADVMMFNSVDDIQEMLNQYDLV